MSGENQIHGDTTLIYADQFAFHRTWIGRFLLIYAGVVLLVFTPMWLYTLLPWQWAVMRAAPAFMAKEFMRQIGFYALGGMAFFIILILLLDWLKFGNLAPDHKKLTYTIDEAIIETRDAAQVVLTLPWSMIRQVTFLPAIIVIKTKAHVTRWMPIRAFSVEDQASLAKFATAAGVPVTRAGKQKA